MILMWAAASEHRYFNCALQKHELISAQFAAIGTVSIFFLLFLAGLPARADIIVSPFKFAPAVVAQDAGAELARAERHFKKGELDLALKVLQEAEKRFPELPPARLMIAVHCLNSDQIAQGRIYLEQAAAEASNHPDVHSVFGELALAEGRISDADLHFQRVASIVAEAAWSAERIRIVQRSCEAGLATVAEARQQWESARKHLGAWLELEPKQGSARQRLANALFNLERIDEAYTELQQACNDDARLEPAAVSMGRLFSYKGDMKKARQWMSHAVEAAPNDLRSRVGYALWLTEQGHYDEANNQANSAARLAPESTDVQRLQGTIARLRKDYVTAEKHLEAVYRQFPADGQACNLLALVLAEQGDEAKSKRALQLATVNARQFPDSQEAVATLGWVYFKAGRAEDAEKALSVAALGRKVSSDVAYMCASVLMTRGRADDARRLLSSALEAPGIFLYRQEADAALKGLGFPQTP